MKRSLLFALLCTLLTLTLVACDKKDAEEGEGEGASGATAEASPAEKACDNIIGQAENIDDLPEEAKADMADRDKCVEEMQANADECENGDEVLGCIAEMKATSMEELGMGMMGCIATCQEKGGAAADPTADPGAADPGAADPGAADPGAADPGAADPAEEAPATE